MENEIQELVRTFKPPAFPGSYFLGLEGIEASGKSTQLVNIKNYLENKGFRTIVLREPGGTTFGERLRQAILQSTTDIHPLAESYLFAASRAQLLHEVILKELATPRTVVIMDRYLDSTIAYQGHARKMGIETILEIHQRFPLTLVPNMTFYLKISSATSISRQKQRGIPQDYFESKGEDFLHRLAEGYDKAKEIFPERIKVIDGEKSVEEAFLQILPYLKTIA